MYAPNTATTTEVAMAAASLKNGACFAHAKRVTLRCARCGDSLGGDFNVVDATRGGRDR